MRLRRGLISNDQRYPSAAMPMIPSRTIYGAHHRLKFTSASENSGPHILKTMSADLSVGHAKPAGEVHSLYRIRERTVPATELTNHGSSGTPLSVDTLAVITMMTNPIVSTCPSWTH